MECRECAAALQIEAGHRTTICPYCRCPSVIERPAAPDRPNPTFVLPFTVTPDRVRDCVTAWTRKSRLLHRSLDKTTIQEIKGIYVPAYLYTAIVHASYAAEIGENYTVTETYTTTVNGKTVTRTRTRTETEWRSLQGEHSAYASDVVVTASRGLPNAELEAIEPFDLRALRRYSPALVSGWLAEEPSLPLATCVEQARQEAQTQEERRLAAFMPGDKHRGLQYNMSVRDETIDPLLVPVWVLSVRPNPKVPAFRVLANGQTAEVWGPEKLSIWKILLWITAALAVIAAVILVARSS